METLHARAARTYKYSVEQNNIEYALANSIETFRENTNQPITRARVQVEEDDGGDLYYEVSISGDSRTYE